MPNNYYGVNSSFNTTVNIISDNDPLNEKFLAPPLRTMADQNAYLYRFMPLRYGFATTGAGPLYTYTGVAHAVQNTIAAGIFVDVPNCVVGDTIDVQAMINITVAATFVSYDFWIDAIDNYAGTPGAETHVPGSHFPGFNSSPINATMVGKWTVAISGTTRFMIACANGGSNAIKITTDASINAMRFPQ